MARIEREIQELFFKLLPDFLLCLRPRQRLIISDGLEHALGDALRKIGQIWLLERIRRHEAQVYVAQFVKILLLKRKHYQVYIIANKLMVCLEIVNGLGADNAETADATTGL